MEENRMIRLTSDELVEILRGRINSHVFDNYNWEAGVFPLSLAMGGFASIGVSYLTDAEDYLKDLGIDPLAEFRVPSPTVPEDLDLEDGFGGYALEAIGRIRQVDVITCKNTHYKAVRRPCDEGDDMFPCDDEEYSRHWNVWNLYIKADENRLTSWEIHLHNLRNPQVVRVERSCEQDLMWAHQDGRVSAALSLAVRSLLWGGDSRENRVQVDWSQQFGANGFAIIVRAPQGVDNSEIRDLAEKVADMTAAYLTAVMSVLLPATRVLPCGEEWQEEVPPED